MGCEGYHAIAEVYDGLNSEVDYGAWADFVEAAFAKFLPAKPELVLDLACGTGRMTNELAARGYDMIGVDGSEDMLACAYASAGEKMPLYLCQDMRSFELYGTVGAAVCCLDSINYLLTAEDLGKTFDLVHNYLDPDGLFLFDVNTPYKFETVYGDNAYVLETERDGKAVYCGWQNEYDAASGDCRFYLSVFTEGKDGKYRRFDETQTEHCYSLEQLKGRLASCGLEFLGVYAGFDFSAPEAECERWYIAARCKK